MGLGLSTREANKLQDPTITQLRAMHIFILRFDGRRKKTERFLQLRIDTEADCVREGDFNEGVFSKDSSILDSLGSRRSLLVLVPKGRQENSRSREQDAAIPS
jgi:hypothetical protein